MSRFIEQDPRTKPFELTPDRQGWLEDYLRTENSDGLSVRRPQERKWMEANQLYEGVSKHPMRTFPIETPSVELTLGAMAVDTVAAQSVDIIWQPKPTLRILPVNSQFQQHAEALQRFTNWMIHAELGLRAAADHFILTDCKYGTAFLATFWTERVKRMMTSKVIERGPRAFNIPLEDLILPGGASAMNGADWKTMRTWLTLGELAERGRRRGWNLEDTQATAQVSQVRAFREHLAGTHQSFTRRGDVYQIGVTFGNFDVDNNGEEMDLLVYHDLTSTKILSAGWNPYDSDPFNWAAYQLRENLIYGLGIMDMAAPFQVAASEFLNEWLINAKLANMRGFIGPPNQFPGDTVKLWAGRYIGVPDPDKVQAFAFAEPYSALMEAVNLIAGFSERRVGVNALANRPSAMLGNRTPGITALTLMQQVARRYTPAFDLMRFAIGGSAKQGLFRYQERLLQGDRRAEETIERIMDHETGLVLEILKDRTFDQQFAVEMTASSTAANILQERQDAIALAGFLGQYYDKVLELTSLASQQGIPPAVRDVATQVGAAMREVIERTVRKFDSVRDPETFVIELENAIDAIPNLPPAGVQGLLGLTQGPGGASQGQPGPGGGLSLAA